MGGEICMIALALSNSNEVVWVSDIDADLDCFSWRLKKSDHKWYVAASMTKKGKHYTLRLHRLIAARMGLCVRVGIDVHHEDGNRLNNTRENISAMGHTEHGNHHARCQAICRMV